MPEALMNMANRSIMARDFMAWRRSPPQDLKLIMALAPPSHWPDATTVLPVSQGHTAAEYRLLHSGPWNRCHGFCVPCQS